MSSTTQPLGVDPGYSEAGIQRQVMQSLEAQGVPVGDINQSDIGVSIKPGNGVQTYDFNSLSPEEQQALLNDPKIQTIQQDVSSLPSRVDQYGNPLGDAPASQTLSTATSNSSQPQTLSTATSNSSQPQTQVAQQQQQQQQLRHQGSNNGDRPAAINTGTGGNKYSNTNRNDNGMYSGVNLPNNSKPEYSATTPKSGNRNTQQSQQSQKHPEQSKCCKFM